MPQDRRSTFQNPVITFGFASRIALQGVDGILQIRDGRIHRAHLLLLANQSSPAARQSAP